MPRFAFRVNGNKDIGMGHVMRCLCLARLLEDCSLFIINDNPKVLEKVREFDCLPIPIAAPKEEDFQVMTDILNCYPKMLKKPMPSEQQELEEVLALLKKEKVDVLIADLVSASREYLETLKEKGFFLINLDELGATHFPSDIVFNCNSVSKTTKYQKEKYTKVYMGSEYVLLRKEFSGLAKRSIQSRLRRILVTCGGTDMKGLSLKILRALQPFLKECEVTLLVGPDFKFRDELNRLLNVMRNIVIKENVKDMRQEMLRSDLAIASGGTTMYELAACGTPAVILCQYEHQNEFANVLEEQGVLVNLGIGEIVDESAIEESVRSLLFDVDKRKAMSGAGQSIIDGNGARRVAQIIQKVLH